jgi:hypothetical protein
MRTLSEIFQDATEEWGRSLDEWGPTPTDSRSLLVKDLMVVLFALHNLADEFGEDLDHYIEQATKNVELIE